jgi:hypothetical protein
LPWFLVLLVSVAIDVVAYLIMPKVSSKSTAAQDAQAPTASAGTPIPVVFGTITVKGTNVLWWGDKSTHTYQVDA